MSGSWVHNSTWPPHPCCCPLTSCQPPRPPCSLLPARKTNTGKHENRGSREEQGLGDLCLYESWYDRFQAKIRIIFQGQTSHLWSQKCIFSPFSQIWSRIWSTVIVNKHGCIWLWLLMKTCSKFDASTLTENRTLDVTFLIYIWIPVTT